MQLGNIGLDIIKKDGSALTTQDIQNIHQELNVWKGQIISSFTIEHIPVTVITYGNQSVDAIAAKISSPLLAEGRLKIRIRLPYPTGGFKDEGANYSNADKHVSVITKVMVNNATIKHTLDTTVYYVHASWKGIAAVKEKAKHDFIITPAKSNDFEFGILFSTRANIVAPEYLITKNNSETAW